MVIKMDQLTVTVWTEELKLRIKHRSESCLNT